MLSLMRMPLALALSHLGGSSQRCPCREGSGERFRNHFRDGLFATRGIARLACVCDGRCRYASCLGAFRMNQRALRLGTSECDV
jgi:hypothetical protein